MNETVTMEQIRTILASITEIDGYKIIERKIDGLELFFIKQELDMNRSKNVCRFQVAIYKDFEEDGVAYRGSSTVQIHPMMSEDELQNTIREAAYAAKFVKNKYYPLVQPAPIKSFASASNFSGSPLSEWIPQLTAAIFQGDRKENASLNSAELFLNKINTRIINSEGVDVNQENYHGELEFITNCRESGEEIELYRDLHFADFRSQQISSVIDRMLELSREKALARQTPALKRSTILLTGEPVRDFLQYYYTQSAAQSVYEQISTLKLGQNVQGADVIPQGDLISLKLNPFLANSTASAGFDEDGLPLDCVTIIERGVLLNYWGNTRYCHYLGVKPTGNIYNMMFEPGSKSVEEMKGQSYLELLAFSDFQMDPLTGNFGGEIRLGRYFDGTMTTFITGGSISGNINEVQSQMYLSQEMQSENNFVGPQTIELKNVAVSGC